MKTITLLFVLLLSLNSFSHCPINFEELDLCGNITWIDGPNDGTTSHFQLTFWKSGDASHMLVSPTQEIYIYSWMIMENGHSHGGPMMSLQQVSEGIYEVQDARFFMHGMNGHWEVRTELLDENDNIITMGTYKVPLIGNGDHDGHHNH